MVGRQIARYRILEQIGSGGMSVVYKGIDTALEREVAVKVLHPHLARREESRQRFSREARAVAKLHHPNILEIFDFSGDGAEESFIVTEYIRGATLRAFGEAHRFHPPEIAAMAVHELACALEHAHAAGIIHRDLKPENVMIRDDGVIKLMDFGIAKVLDRDERMTVTGALVGSPAHMAPEIIEGLEAVRETDIFSLGTILYWLCCAKLPFLGNNTTQTLKLILEGAYPDPRLENPAVSDELAGLIARCLAREPSARFPSAADARDALAALLLGYGIERPGEDFAAFYADPPGYRERFRLRLTSQLLGHAEKCTSSSGRNHARALDCLNRVLALDPTNERAKALLDRMRKRGRRRRNALIAGAAVAGVIALGAASFGLWTAMQPGPHVAEPVGGPRPAIATIPSTPVPGQGGTPATKPEEPDPPGTPGAGTPDPIPTAAAGSDTAKPAGTANDSAKPPVANGSVASATAGDPSTPAAGAPGARGGTGEKNGGNPRTASPRTGTARGETGSGARPPRPPGTGASGTNPAATSTAGGERVAAVTPTPPPAPPPAPADRELSIRFTPAHYARIFLDGKHVNPNQPLFTGPVAVGSHRVRIESDMCDAWEGEVDVPADGPVQPVVARLNRRPATLTVRSPLKDMMLVINGTARGTSAESEADPVAIPLPEGQVKGQVTIHLYRSGYRPKQLSEEFVAGTHRELTVELAKQ